MAIHKIKASEFLHFKTQFFRTDLEQYKRLRFGQAFINKFFPSQSDAQLFYCENHKLAEKIIFEHYVEED